MINYWVMIKKYKIIIIKSEALQVRNIPFPGHLHVETRFQNSLIVRQNLLCLLLVTRHQSQCLAQPTLKQLKSLSGKTKSCLKTCNDAHILTIFFAYCQCAKCCALIQTAETSPPGPLSHRRGGVEIDPRPYFTVGIQLEV